MKDLSGKIAVVTGGGTGMGRELVRQLLAEGCHVATCDVIEENLQETLSICKEEAPQGVRVTGHICDVALEDQVLACRKEVEEQHQTKHINLLFNNAGIGGGGSFVDSTRDEWERTFDICWNGVYYFCRAFLPMLLESSEGHIVNTSSVNGFRASLGGNIPHTAYSAAKFAVKGFTEALINDFRFNAPHLKASIVMPGGVGTDIAINSGRILGQKNPKDWTDEDINRVRQRWRRWERIGQRSAWMRACFSRATMRFEMRWRRGEKTTARLVLHRQRPRPSFWMVSSRITGEFWSARMQRRWTELSASRLYILTISTSTVTYRRSGRTDHPDGTPIKSTTPF